MNPLDKASIIYAHEDQAFQELAHIMIEKWEEIVQVAKGRHILGHYEYGDTNLFEWSDGKVLAAIMEEFADALVYQCWLEERNESS